MMEDLLLTKLRTLSPMQQQEVLDFVEFLAHRPGYSLDRVLARIREGTQAYDPAELDVIIEEARDDYYKAQSKG